MFQLIREKTLGDFTTEQLVEELSNRFDFIQSVETSVMIRELVNREVSLKEIVECLTPIKVEKEEIQGVERQNQARHKDEVKKEEERGSRASRALLNGRQELKEEFKVKQEAKIEPGPVRINGQRSETIVQNHQYYQGMNRLQQSEDQPEEKQPIDIKQRSLSELIEIAYRLKLVSRQEYAELKDRKTKSLQHHPDLAQRIVDCMPQYYYISGPEVPIKHYTKSVSQELQLYYRPYYERVAGVLMEEDHQEPNQEEESYDSQGDMDDFINDEDEEEVEVEVTVPRINPRHVPRKREREHEVEEDAESSRNRKRSKMELKSEDEAEENKYNKLKRNTSSLEDD